MAINPNDITTVSVPELPPAPISDTSEFAHSVDDILSKCSGLDLKNYLRSLVGYAQYEVKQLIVPSGYVAENFDQSATSANGLGLVGELWEGWAIINGNNGTPNADGRALIAYGAEYPTIGEFLGEEKHLLSIDEMPAHNHGLSNVKKYNDTFGTNGLYDRSQTGTPSGLVTDNAGGGQAHNNMQPSMVVLMIMKL